MKTKLITGRYKGYEVCYANKGQIFPRDGWYLTKGDDVIYIEDAISQTREETIREVEERLPKAQKINKKDWLGLNYTLGDVKYREHQYRLLVLDILNKLKK